MKFKSYKAFTVSILIVGLFLLFISARSQQIIAFPDDNLRTEILNEYGIGIKGVNNGAVLLAGTNKIDFSQLNASNPDPATHGINGVTQIFASVQGEINSLSGLEQLTKLTSLSIQENSSLQFPAGFENLPLQYLDICSNNLTSLPSNFDKLTSLSSLMICFNKFAALPNLPPNLTYLEVEYNDLSSLSNLPNSLLSLDASYNKLTNLSNLPSSLTSLYIQNNNLTALPSLPVGLTFINASNNKLTFEDFEPIISLFPQANGGAANYSNQANFSITPSIKNLITGQTLNLTATGFIAGSVNNRYKWYKNGIAVSQKSANPTFTIANVTQADAGSYVCAVTNTVVTDLTISSDPVVVSVSAPVQQWAHYDKTNSPIGDVSKITSISVGPDNNVWIAAGDTVFRRKADDSWTVYPVATTNGLVYASVISTGPNGVVWVAANNDLSGKLSRFDGNSWQTIVIPKVVISNYPYVADIEITNNNIWIAAGGGLLKFDGQTWTKLDYQGKLTSPTSVSWDKTTQELWISNNCAPEGNVFKYIPATNTWTEYQMGNSLCAHAVQAINGGALVGSCNYSSVVSIKSEQVQPYIKTECINLAAVAIDPANSSQAWFGADRSYLDPSVPSGLILFDGTSVVKNLNNLNSGMKGNGVTTLAAQQKGSTIVIWMITFNYDPVNSLFKNFLETYTYSTGDLTPQSITFNELPVKKTGDLPFKLTASTTSGLPVTYTSADPNVATISGDDVTITGVGTTKITASQPGNDVYAPAENQYQFLVVNSAPCNPIPQPFITSDFTNPSAPALTSSSVDGNQWFRNGDILNDETNRILQVKQAGTYSVQVTQNSCISAMSDGTIIVITEIDKKPVCSLYPNPAESEIRFIPFEVGPTSIQIIDVVGQSVKDFNYYFQENEIIVDIRNLSSGSYILKYLQSGHYQNMYFIKK